MATEVISSRQFSALPDIPEDVSNGSTDVDMMVGLVGNSDQKPLVVVDSSAVSTGVNGPVVVAVAPSSPSSISTLVSADEASDAKAGSTSPNVHHHHHYHYFYHHHFHHANSGTKQRELLATSKSNNRLMITSGTTATSGDDQSPVVQEPVSPITPTSPLDGSSPSSLSAQNTSALVRTISNGSTFGPINPSNWPLLFPIASQSSSTSSPSSSSQSRSPVTISSTIQQSNAVTSSGELTTNHAASATATAKDTSSSSFSDATSGTTLNQANPSNNANLSNSDCTHSQRSGHLLTSPSSSGSVLKRLRSSTTSQPTVTANSHHHSVHCDDDNATVSTANPTTPATPTTTPSNPSESATSAAATTNNSSAVTQQPPSRVPTTILATTICPPAQPNFQITLDLPLSFGDKYILTSQIEASNLYRCLRTDTMEEYCCKVVLSKDYTTFLAPHLRMDGHEGISQVQQIVVGRAHTFILFNTSYGDLHTYVRTKRRLREPEAMALFQQIVQIVADCHTNGIILRDLKLRKFIFSNKERTQLKLENLEGASVFDDDDDTLTDKHGCPAYVSPEILYSTAFSGTAADCWSLGVVLYTMLVGRYPFHDANPSVVFCKIRRGTYFIPDTLSKHAKCLIRSLIRIDPEQRLTGEDALAHRWFKAGKAGSSSGLMLKRSPPSSSHQHSSLSAAAAAAINHHHYHHHHHHHSASGSAAATTTSTTGNNQSASESSFNEQDATPFTNSSSNPNAARVPFLPSNSSSSSSSATSSRFTTLLPSLLAQHGIPASSISRSGSTPSSSSHAHHHHQHDHNGNSMCCYHLASQCDQIVPDLSPTNEDDIEMMTD